MKNLYGSILILLNIFSVLEGAAQDSLTQGIWRGTFQLTEGHEAPFNFELTSSDLILINGTDRFELKNYRIQGDSLFVSVDIYDAALEARITDPNHISGKLRKFNTATPDKGIAFAAKAGEKYRFFEHATADVSLNGTWELYIGSGTETKVGEFKQTGSKLTGSILTTTGDYRYLEGAVQGNEFYLSAFSGSAPSLIRGKVNGNNLQAELIGTTRIQPITGKRNATAALPDAYTLTTLKEGTAFNFSFPDAFTGQTVSLADEKYRNKVVIVTILGSWCPNCLDEALFLSPWYKANKNRGLEIVGIAYERKNDPEFAKARLTALKKRLEIDYDLLFGGLADKEFVAGSLPSLSNFLSFPTTLYIGKDGKVHKIHTGFSGPATGRFYEEFVKDFNENADNLLSF